MDQAELDRMLARTHEIAGEDLSDETDEELGHLLPALVEAGYAHVYGQTSTGELWNLTERGLARLDALGLK
jgi:hypothetical protein